MLNLKIINRFESLYLCQYEYTAFVKQNTPYCLIYPCLLPHFNVMHFRSFQAKLFLSVGGIFLLFVFFFMAYQYNREKEFKTETMHASLQVFNHKMALTLGDSITSQTAFDSYLDKHPMEGLRVTIINMHGKVILDNYHSRVLDLPNHRDRSEVRQALNKGDGYEIMRRSESTNQTYFYSATLAGSYVIRSAMPYDARLVNSLSPAYSFIWYAIFITLLLGFVLFRATSRISRHIRYLRQFAIKANSGDKLDHELERRLPDDELGDISHTIISLFWRLKHSEDDKQRLKQQLTQNAAHELKTPAASVNGYLESIVSNPQMPETTRQRFIERCYAQSQRMCHLLQDMSTLVQMDEAPLVDNHRDISTLPAIEVGEVLYTILEESAEALQSKGIRPVVSIPDNVTVHCEQSVLYGIFRNLVDNALAYATGATELRFSCERESIGNSSSYVDRWYRFSVSDNGCGVDTQHLPRLFERFYRVDKGRSRNMGGTGLGLAIVKNSITMYGGKIQAQNTPGGGLTIVFTLR